MRLLSENDCYKHTDSLSLSKPHPHQNTYTIECMKNNYQGFNCTSKTMPLTTPAQLPS